MIITRCPHCRYHKLMNDDWWETTYSEKKANNLVHEACMKSIFLRSIANRDCSGCASLSRRHIKVLVNLLIKLGTL
jgi:hypothetical protein